MKTLLLFLLLSFTTALPQNESKFISVTGTSEIVVPADQINFSVQIRTISESIQKSKKLNDDAKSRLLSILKDLNIDTEDLEVSPVSLGRNYVYSEGERKQDGFYASIVVTFILKKLDNYLELTDRLAEDDNYEVNSSFSISNYEAKHKEAYQKALIAAKEKAEYMTKTLNVELGEVIEIEESGMNQNYPMPFNSMTKEDSQAGFVNGKVTISRNVKVKFALK